LNRAASPVFGDLVGPRSYLPIRRAFIPIATAQAEFTLPSASLLLLTKSGIAQAAANLRHYGIVVLESGLGEGLLNAAREEADVLVARINAAIDVPGNTGEVGNLLWQVGYEKYTTYDRVAELNRPVANLRSRERGTMNGGLIDVFSVEKAAWENGWWALGACCRLLASDTVMRIVETMAPRTCGPCNLLRNDSVTVTRGLHVDNLRDRYKTFLYLGDVGDAGDGPYAYVPGTHRRQDLLRREARLNSLADRPVSDSVAFEGYEVPVLGPKGTVIISCQSGVHRGLPQRPGASRTVLVGNLRD
jgi:hypothetical protein